MTENINEPWAVFEDENFGQGFTQIPNIIMRNPDLSMQAKYMYGLLLSYAWQNPDCFPGLERLRGDTGAKIDTIRKYIKELVDAGYILVERRGNMKTNRYVFRSIYSAPADNPHRGASPTGDHPQRGTSMITPNGGYKEYSVEKDPDTTSSRKTRPKKITHLDPVIQSCLEILRAIKYFPRDEPHVAQKLTEYREKFVGVDPEEVCEDYREYCEDKRKTNPSLLQLRNFFKKRFEDNGPRRRENAAPRIRQKEIT